jgi:pimeloyl-ACP methyl ester carboxylesterase
LFSVDAALFLAPWQGLFSEKEGIMNSVSDSKVRIDTKVFTHEADGINWYCELRGSGPTIVLIPSGEGDCDNFSKVASALAAEFTVLTFDMPGFSRSSAPPDFGVVTAKMLGDQITALTASLGFVPATFYGCSSGGQAALSLVADHSDAVRNVIVHEAALMSDRDTCWPGEMAGAFAALGGLGDAALSGACADMFRNRLNRSPQAWNELGPEYHERLQKNYITWVRHYHTIADRSYSAEELLRKPITWSVGGYREIWAMTGNFRTAHRANIEIVYLRSRHFPQVCVPDELAQHIRENTKRYL